MTTESKEQVAEQAPSHGEEANVKAVDEEGEGSKDAQQQQPSTTEHKVHSKCMRHKAKSKRDKKVKQEKSSSSSSSSSSESSSDSESDSDVEADSSSSSSEEDSRKKKSKKSKKYRKDKKSKRSRRKDVENSSDAESDDEPESSSESEEESKRSKKSKKRSRQKRRNALRSPSPLPDEEEDSLEKAKDLLQGLGIKVKGLKRDKNASKNSKKEESSTDESEDDRRSKKKGKKHKRSSSRSGKRKTDVGKKKPIFFRGDELWDRENHQYEVKPTKTRKKADPASDYVFTVKRRFDWEGKYEDTVVNIHAKPLRDCLRKVMESCKAVSLVEDEPQIDPEILFLYLEDMRDYWKALKNLLKADRRIKKKDRKALELKKSQLKCMLRYLDKDFASTKAALYPMLEEGTITFDLLWTLFRSDTIVYNSTYGSESEPRAFRVEYCNKESSFTKGVWYDVIGKYFDFDGKDFGLGNVQAEVSSFKGVRKISSLSCYPIKYHPKYKELSEQLIERGKNFVSLAGMQYKFLKGMAFMKRKGTVLKINVNGRVMCDPATFRRINPNYPISNVKKEDPDLLPECSDDDCESDQEKAAVPAACTCADCLAADPNAFAQRKEVEDEPKKRWKRIRDPKTRMFHYVQVAVDENGIEIRNPDQPQGTRDHDLEVLTSNEHAEKDDKDEAVGSQDIFSDEELLIASPVILGFAFSEKMWLEFSVSGIQNIQWNEGAFDSLVIPDAQKNIVKALVSAHAAESKADNKAEASGEAAGKVASGRQNIDDVIQGKGRGLVSVLHGSPGTGKTLTAEGVAELLQCPLYCVSAGELGTNPRDLETELTKILDVAHVWGAVLLLDEADVFLEARTAQDIHRNALVSIFLRLLEYFQGILFLTTNRVATFDEAFQSRIHIALRYQELDYKARRKVWEMFLSRVKALVGAKVDTFGKDELDRLARKNNLNGRQIKNVVRSAQALAVNEGKPLSMNHIETVLDVAQSFERDLKGGSGYAEAMRSYT